MRFLRNTIAVAITAAALGACAPATEQAQLGALESRTTLLVKNNNWQEVVIYMMRGSMRTRLGSVNSMGQARFRISDTMLTGTGDVRIVADPIGSERTYTSPAINVVPGSEVELQVQNVLSISSFAVYQ
jgi:hypothetical protein